MADLEVIVQEPVDLGGGITLQPIPPAFKTASNGLGLTWEQLWTLSGCPTLALVRTYEADGPQDPMPDWSDPPPITRQQYNRDLLKLANLAVWLVRPEHAFWHSRTFDVEQTDGGWVVHSWSSPPALRRYRTGRGLLTPGDLEEAKELNETTSTLARAGPLWIAIRCIWGALVEGWFHGRYMLLWVALEALFGPRGGGRVRRPLSWRIAGFLESDQDERLRLFETALRDYDCRSAVAHGEGERVAQDGWTMLMHRAEEWARITPVLGDERDHGASFVPRIRVSANAR